MARDARPSAINHRLRETYGWTEAQANRAMQNVCLEILTSQKDRYISGTLVKTRRLLWGEAEDFIGYHWSNRKSGELRDDWVSNESIAHLLTPPTSLQESEKYNAAAIASFVSPYTLRWPLLILLIAGLVANLRSEERWAGLWIVLLVLALVFPAAALVGYVPRYRYPADPFMAVLIGGGGAVLLELLGSWLQGARRRLANFHMASRDPAVNAPSSPEQAAT